MRTSIAARALCVALPGALFAAAGPPALGQITVGPQTRVDAKPTGPCNETTVGVSKANPLEVVAAWNDYREGTPRTGVALSLDGGETWSDFLLRPAPPFRSSVEGDPMTAHCDRTGTLWAGGMSFAGNGGIFVARKDPGSPTFGPPVMARVSGGVDKGWMVAGPRPGAPDETNLYIAYNEGVIRSTDMGASWSAPVSLGPGLGFLPRVGPGGELYVAYWNPDGAGDHMSLRRSFDAGASFGPEIVVALRMDVWGLDSSRTPGTYRNPHLAGLGVDPDDGTLYYVYPDTTDIQPNGFNVDVYFSRSTDQGATWSTPVVVNTDAATPGDQFFPFADVDGNGRVHLVFHDTRGVVQQDSASTGLIDTYYAYSDDQGATWAEIDLTATPMDSALAFSGGFFIGDYLGIASAGRRTFPVYMDTDLGNADIYTNVVADGPATEYCFGIGCPCGNDDPEAGCGNTGSDADPSTGGHLAASGTADISSDDLVLTMSGIRAGESLILAASQNRNRVPFGDGFLCVAAPIFRYPLRRTDGSGAATYGPGEVIAISLGFGAAGQVVSGSTWSYMGWYRDPPSPCGSQFNTTNAVSVTWF